MQNAQSVSPPLASGSLGNRAPEGNSLGNRAAWVISNLWHLNWGDGQGTRVMVPQALYQFSHLRNCLLQTFLGMLLPLSTEPNSAPCAKLSMYRSTIFDAVVLCQTFIVFRIDRKRPSWSPPEGDVSQHFREIEHYTENEEGEWEASWLGLETSRIMSQIIQLCSVGWGK